VVLLETGIGKVNAAASVSRALSRARYRAVVNLGIAGALPGAAPLELLCPVVATESVYADEGLQTPTGFLTCDQMGFPLGPFAGNAVPGDAGLRALAMGALGGWHAVEGGVATVSCCSGTDTLARRVAERTGAVAECMEGAAVGHTTTRFSDEFPAFGARFLEVRVISNTTGDRPGQRWDVQGSMRRLAEVASSLLPALRRWSESAPGA
jgi:futalosine hydrolase